MSGEQQLSGEDPWSGQSSDNLTTLTHLTEHTLLTALQQRYQDDRIYTDVGDILIAVNPFKLLPLYSEEWSLAYSRIDVNSLSPHIFKVASRAYNAMVSDRKDQVCVISGESGAGKTESAKFIMHQVMTMCRSAGMGQELQHKIAQLNPILEAFGNAQTALNNNSSRFGKYVQLVFESSGRIVGAGLQQYLLEKSRVCVQGGKERNFHIFYYLYAGLSSNQKQQFGLKEPSDHRYLNSYPDLHTDCASETSRGMYNVVMESMSAVGFSEEELNSVLTILAAVLLLGDIDFTGEDNASVSTRAEAEAAATILQLDSCESLCFALTKLRTETRGEVVDKCYTVTKAKDVRDGVAKALYARLFQWIVARLNGYLQPYPDNDQLTMGILDIFGFENFEVNSFEQFCINLANEQLQCYFNHQIFAMEKMELEKEGLEGIEISFTDNKPVLDLFLSKPIGLLSLLNDQCRGLNGSNKAFVHKCKESFAKHPNYVPHRGNALVFTVKHYAGNVEYKAGGFLDKNKDSLPDPVVETLRSSALRLSRTLFVRHSEQPAASQIKKSALPRSQKSVMKALSFSKRRKSSVGRKQKGVAKKLLTVSAHFRQSLEDLMERLCSATPHFVRCLKPNLQKVPREWGKSFMLKQLQYTGMLEAVRVRREGFAYRPFFSAFFSTYHSLAYKFTDESRKGCEMACREILKRAGLEDWRMGSSRVFLRYYHQEKLQLLLRQQEDSATLIQRLYRGYHTRKMTSKLRERQKREKEMVTTFLTTMNKVCEDHFPTIVALNRTDNLLANERFAHRREATPTPPQEDTYAGLNTQQRNIKRAQALGVKMIISNFTSSGPPSFTPPPPPTSPTPSPPTSPTSTPSHITHSQVSNSDEDDVTVEHPSPDCPTPLPRSRTGSTEDTPLTPSPPVPAPRKRLRQPITNSTPLTDHTPTDQAPLHQTNEVPHYTISVSPSNEATPTKREQPVPKPRKRSTPSPRQLSPSPRQQEPRAEIRVPLLSHGDDEVSLDFFPGDRRVSHDSEEGESVLDFISTGRLPKLVNRGETSLVEPDPDLSAEGLYRRRPSMTTNLLNLRILANSTTSLATDDETMEIRRQSLISIGSDSLEHPPPQADKRKVKKGFGLGAGWKQRGRSRHNSCTSSNGSVREMRCGSVSSDCGGESSDLLGYYPHLDQLAGEDFVLGQPLGTYAICRPISTDGETTPSGHALVLSLGRSVTTLPILTDHTSCGETFHVDTHPLTFPLLRELISHYKSHAVCEGVCLSQPRLLAGVYVPSAPPPKKPPISPRRRVVPVPRKRTKLNKPAASSAVLTEIPSVA